MLPVNPQPRSVVTPQPASAQIPTHTAPPRCSIAGQHLLLIALLLTTAWHPLAAQENWARFRGEAGLGVSTQAGIPVTWTADQIAWKVQLPTIGHSSPVIWGQHLFVTSATEGGSERFMHCLDAASGKQLWNASFTMEASRKHQKNSWASSTPCTDGRVVCGLFADAKQLVAKAWDFSGTELWSVELGSYESEHNLGVSPIIEDGLVLIANDQVGPSSFIALQADTGTVAWKTERQPGKTSYSTPTVTADGAGGKQIVCVSESGGVSGIDLKSGKALWQTPKLPMRTVASPIVMDGLAFATCGEGGNGKYFAAVRTGLDVPNDQRIAWERRTMLPYVPCLIRTSDLLFLWGDKGIMVCLEAATGNEVWSERIDGQYSGSPILIQDRIYCVTEDGIVVVLQAGRQFRELGRTPLGDDCHSTPAVAAGHLYFHTFKHVIAVKATP